MQSPDASSAPEKPSLLDPENAPPLPRGILGRWPALTYVLPFAVYMFFTALVETRIETKEQAYAPGGSRGGPHEADNKPPEELTAKEIEEQKERHHRMPYAMYGGVYATKIAATVVAMLLVIPGYRAWPFRVNGIAWVVGVVGVVVWIGLCKLNLEQRLLVPLGLGSLVEMGERPAFNPLVELADNPTWAYTFLAIRLFGLAIVVPIIEEFFLRGFLVRFVMHVDWFWIPFGKVDRLGLITSIAFPILMHTAELFAAAAWFSMITWLMLRTRNIWDCVIAHAVTNALLGAYVLATGEWQFM
jgi:CAAX prenyl protease-like protein